jgi:hypothetical protein
VKTAGVDFLGDFRWTVDCNDGDFWAEGSVDVQIQGQPCSLDPVLAVYYCEVGKNRTTPSVMVNGKPYYQYDLQASITPELPSQHIVWCDDDPYSAAESFISYQDYVTGDFVRLGYIAACPSIDPGAGAPPTEDLYFFRQIQSGGTVHNDYIGPWSDGVGHMFKLRRDPGNQQFHFFIDGVERWPAFALAGTFQEQRVVTSVSYQRTSLIPTMRFESEVLPSAPPPPCSGTCAWPSWNVTPFLLQQHLCYFPESGSHWLSADRSDAADDWTCG